MPVPDPSVKFSIIDVFGESVSMISHSSQKFNVCVDAYCYEQPFRPTELIFTFGGIDINPELTIAQLGIYDGCTIKVDSV
ncbi:MAG TPA: hypothetical protein VLE02_01310 [Nitrosarchaeum sp.]|nr:hypothetical protein [Nitrosarchaeum sp.]